jgi:divalent metal cation (Fe/Co/Zn/Cd) transporter
VVADRSTTIVLVALGFNALIALAKLAAAAFTGSSAMLAEAVHSLVGASSQALLLHGIRRLGRPPGARHRSGYARELYFWSFVVAILLYSMGAGVAIYEGIVELADPHPMSNPELNYVVLGMALVLVSGSAIVAVRRQAPSLPIRASEHPVLFTVLVADIAAIAGLMTALIGIAMAHLAGIEAADGIASIVIGLILGCVAAFLSIEVKGLLVGEAASEELRPAVARPVAAGRGRRTKIPSGSETGATQLESKDVPVAAGAEVDSAALAADAEAVTGPPPEPKHERKPTIETRPRHAKKGRGKRRR